MINIVNYSAGHYEQGPGYQYFVPNHLCDEWQWPTAELGKLLERAAASLGGLNTYSRFAPNVDLFIQLHVTKEAVVSSQIEGTQTSIEEALLPEAAVSCERRDDWHEVNNYIAAMNLAIGELERLPISGRLLRATHSRLMQGVRGEHKMPGEFRTSQNWIGGKTPADARYVPPSHILVPELIGDLERFLNSDDTKLPALLKIAIAHYQFESIHPFLDGNGRTGRLLITLYLISTGLLSKPMLYLSSFFESRRDLYYDNLTTIRTKGDMLHWLKYFLVGVDETSRQATETLERIMDYKTRQESVIRGHLGVSANRAIPLFHKMLEHPQITVEQAATLSGMPYTTTNNTLRRLTEIGVVSLRTSPGRTRLFALREYLDMFK